MFWSERPSRLTLKSCNNECWRREQAWNADGVYTCVWDVCACVYFHSAACAPSSREKNKFARHFPPVSVQVVPCCVYWMWCYISIPSWTCEIIIVAYSAIKSALVLSGTLHGQACAGYQKIRGRHQSVPGLRELSNPDGETRFKAQGKTT